jgi:hypothetical protein
MRSPDDDAVTPEMAGALVAVDSTLAGEPVDPQYAELAELALILRRERPPVGDSFASYMDERVQRRFAQPARPRRAWRRRWLFAPGAAGAAVAGVLAVIVVAGGSGGVSNSASSPAFAGSSSASASSVTAAGSSSVTAAGSSAVASPVPAASAPPQAKTAPARDHRTAVSAGQAVSAAQTSASAVGTVSASGAPAPAPGPVSTGNRQIVQSAQLQLSTAPNRIDDVAQQVFDVVGAENGIVNSSNVTATGNINAGADFQLSVPSANLGATLTALSRLRGAHVVSRTDTTADITGQVGGAGGRLAEARALRRSLLKQLAAASTTEQVNSLQLQLRDADASISSDLSALRGLQRQVAYSKITLSIQAAVTPVPVPAKGSSFTISRAAHDAGRVLVVVAGVALITLAVLLPVALLAALAARVGLSVRRRRREQALDLV